MAFQNNRLERNRRAQFRSCVLPFKSGTSAHPEQTMENSSLSSSPNNAYVSSIRTGRTIREVSKEIDDLRKENFNLKLRIYFVEEKLTEICGKDNVKNLKVNIDMQIQVKELEEEIHNLQDQLAIKDRMLDECLKTSREKENELKKASQIIAVLQDRLNKSVQGENSDEKYFSPLDSGNESAIYKAAFGISETPATSKITICPVASHEKLSDELEKLKNELIAQTKELKSSNSKIQKLEGDNKKLEELGKKKSRSIEALMLKLKKDSNSSEILELIKTGNKAASNRDIAKVVATVDKIKLHFSELLSLPVNEIFCDKPISVPKLEQNEIAGKSCLIGTDDDYQLGDISQLRSLLREKDQVIKLLMNEKGDLQSQLHEATSQKEIFAKQAQLLQNHLEKLARFLEQLLHGEFRSSFESSSDMLNQVSSYVHETLRLSQSMSQNLSVWDLSKNFPLNETSLNLSFEDRSLPSLPMKSGPEQVAEGRTAYSETSGANVTKTGRRRRWSEQPENNLSKFDRLMMFGLSDSGDVLQSTFSETPVIKPSPYKPRQCWNLPDKLDSLKILNKEPPMQSLLLTSDSDVWSEPDRNVSIQRIGIEPKLLSPATKRRAKEHLSSSTASKCDNRHRRRRSGSLSRILDKRLSVIENKQHKLSSLQDVLEKVAKNLDVLTKEKEARKLEQDSIVLSSQQDDVNFQSEMSSLKSVLDSVMEELQALKETMRDTASKTGDGVIQEFKDTMERVLKSVQSDEDSKVTKDIAKKALTELDTFKKQLLSVVSSLIPRDSAKELAALSQTNSEDLSTSIPYLELLISSEKDQNDKLLQDVAELTARNETLQEQFTALETNLNNKQKELDEIKLLLKLPENELQMKCLSSEKLCETLKSELKETETKLLKMQETCKCYEENLLQPIQKTNDYQQTFTLQKDQMDKYVNLVKDLQNLCNEQKKESEITKSDLNNLQSKCLNLEAELEILTLDKAKLTQTNLTLCGTITAHLNTITDISEKLTVYKTELSSKDKIISDQENCIDNLTKKMQVLEDKFIISEGLNASLQEETESFASEAKKHVEYPSKIFDIKIRNLNYTVDHLREELNDKGEILQDQRKVISDLQSDIQALETKTVIAKTFHTELVKNQLNVSDTSPEVQEVLRSTVELKTEVIELEDTMKKLQSELADKALLVSSLMSEKNELLDERNSREVYIDSLKARIEKLKLRIENLNKDEYGRIIKRKDEMISELRRAIISIDQIENSMPETETTSEDLISKSSSFEHLEKRIKIINIQVGVLKQEVQEKTSIIQEQKKIIENLQSEMKVALEVEKDESKQYSLSRKKSKSDTMVSKSVSFECLENEKKFLSDQITVLKRKNQDNESIIEDQINIIKELKSETLIKDLNTQVDTLKKENEKKQALIEKQQEIIENLEQDGKALLNYEQTLLLQNASESENLVSKTKSYELLKNEIEKRDIQIKSLKEEIQEKELKIVDQMKNCESHEQLRSELEKRDIHVESLKDEILKKELIILNQKETIETLQCEGSTLLNYERNLLLENMSKSEDLIEKSKSFERLQNKIVEQDAKLQSLKQEIQDKELTIKDQKNVIESLQHEENILLDCERDLLLKNMNETEKLVAKSLSFDRLRSEIEELNIEIKDLKQELKVKEELIEGQNDVMRNLQNEKNVMLDNAKMENSKLLKEIELESEKLIATSNSLERLQNEMKNLQTQIIELKEEVKEKETIIDDLKDTIESKNQEENSLLDRERYLLRVNMSDAEELVAKSQSLDRLKIKLEEWDVEIKHLKEEIQEKELIIQNQKDIVENLENVRVEKNSLIKEKESLEFLQKDLRNEVEVLKEVIQKKESVINDQNTMIEDLKSQENVLLGYEYDLVHKNLSQSNSFERIKIEMESLCAEIDDLKKEVQKKEAIIEDQKNFIKGLESEHNILLEQERNLIHENLLQSDQIVSNSESFEHLKNDITEQNIQMQSLKQEITDLNTQIKISGNEILEKETTIKKQKDIIEHLQDKLNTMAEAAKIEKDNLMKEQDLLLQRHSELDKLKDLHLQRINTLTAENKTLTEKVLSSEKVNDTLKEDLTDIKHQNEQTYSSLNKRKSKYLILKNQNQELKIQIEKLKSEVKKLFENISSSNQVSLSKPFEELELLLSNILKLPSLSQDHIIDLQEKVLELKKVCEHTYSQWKEAQEIASTFEQELSSKHELILQFQTQLSEYQNLVKNYQDRYGDKNKTPDEKNDKLTQLQDEIQSLEQKFSAFQEDFAEKQSQNERETYLQQNSIEKGIEDKAEFENEMHRVGSKKKKLLNRNEDFKQELQIKSRLNSELEKTLKKLRSELESSHSQIEQLENALMSKEIKCQKLEKENENLLNKIEHLKPKLNFPPYVKELDERIQCEDLKNLVKSCSYQQILNIDDKFQALNSTVSVLKDELSNKSGLLITEQQKCEQLKKQLNAKEEKLQKLQTKNNRLKYGKTQDVQESEKRTSSEMFSFQELDPTSKLHKKYSYEDLSQQKIASSQLEKSSNDLPNKELNDIQQLENTIAELNDVISQLYSVIQSKDLQIITLERINCIYKQKFTEMNILLQNCDSNDQFMKVASNFKSSFYNMSQQISSLPIPSKSELPSRKLTINEHVNELSKLLDVSFFSLFQYIRNFTNARTPNLQFKRLDGTLSLRNQVLSLEEKDTLITELENALHFKEQEINGLRHANSYNEKLIADFNRKAINIDSTSLTTKTLDELIIELSILLKTSPVSLKGYISKYSTAIPTDNRDKNLGEADYQEILNQLEKEKFRLAQELNESKRNNIKSQIQIQKLMSAIEGFEGKHSNLFIEASQIAKSDTLLKEENLHDIAYVNQLKEHKWSLQRSILKLEKELCKAHPSSLQKLLYFIDHVSVINNKIQSLSAIKNQCDSIICSSIAAGLLPTPITREFVLNLQLDVECLKNTKTLLKYLIVPLFKNLKSETKLSATLHELSENVSQKFDTENWASIEVARGANAEEENSFTLSKRAQGISRLQPYSSKDLNAKKSESDTFLSKMTMPSVRLDEPHLSPYGMKSSFSTPKQGDKGTFVSLAQAVHCPSDSSSSGVIFTGYSQKEQIPRAKRNLKFDQSPPQSDRSGILQVNHPTPKFDKNLPTLEQNDGPLASRSHFSSPDLGIFSDPNQEPLTTEILYKGKSPGIRSRMETNVPYAVIILENFELLQKEITECIINTKSIESRSKNGLKMLYKEGTPKRSFECNTLKGILDSYKEVEMCLRTAQELLSRFSFTFCPGSGGHETEPNSFFYLERDNKRLQIAFGKMKEERDLMSLKLNSALDRLKIYEKKKELSDKVLLKQLIKTKKVLREVKDNFSTNS